ncbi:MAG: LacI family DNA-binding transcriptional regulator [Caldicoprobacterales bacterium]|jgi:DNA-binding LacI/PurR family transcriptional regulator|nr:LacI family transcriptional regulator [Clostridiales bacterium]
MTVRLTDIAKHLGISVSTVSRVINGKDRVSDETRKRVLQAVKELNYQPNEIARSLRNRSSMTIGIIVPDLSNDFFNLLTKGAAMVSKKDDYLVILCNSDHDESMEQEYMNLLIQKQVDGIIIATVCKDKLYFERVINNSIPVVFVDNLPKVDMNYNFVTIDNTKASFDLTCHLINMGYKDIAVLTGSLHETSAVRRLNGWEKAMKANNLEINNDFIGIGDFRMESGYRLMKDMLKLDKRPDALMAANNHLAYGAIKAARDHGLNVPDDLYVVCFDALDNTGLFSVKIPSMVQPAEKIGEIAAEIIIKRIKDRDYKIYDNVILEPIFIN